jgi:uncharacterized protein
MQLATLVEDHERADILDALRGFALLGIFISHMPDYAGTHVSHPVAEFLIRGKFFSLFSFLFGIGFAVQIDSAARRGASFNRHFIRRLSALLVIGLVHACVWYGDILKDYALIGFVLLLTARSNIAALARVTALVLLLRIVWPLLVWAIIPVDPSARTAANPVGEFESLSAALHGTDLAAAARANLELVRLKALQMIYDGRVVSVLGMFLIGALVGRLRIYRDLVGNGVLIRRVFLICTPIGVAGNAVLVPLHAATPDYPPSGMWIVEQCLFAIAVPAMALAYASGFALLWQRGWSSGLRALAPAGRMALTTYVSQTLIGIAVFYGIGLGIGLSIGHELSFAAMTSAAVAIFALQCVASRIWLRSFLFGPLEWLWRRATYGTPVAMLRRAAAHNSRRSPSETR